MPSFEPSDYLKTGVVLLVIGAALAGIGLWPAPDKESLRAIAGTVASTEYVAGYRDHGVLSIQLDALPQGEHLHVQEAPPTMDVGDRIAQGMKLQALAAPSPRHDGLWNAWEVTIDGAPYASYEDFAAAHREEGAWMVWLGVVFAAAGLACVARGALKKRTAANG